MNLKKTQSATIDREALVARHKISLHGADPGNALTVGNGEFAYTFDITGMQTFTDVHDQAAAWEHAQQNAAKTSPFTAPPTVNTATMSNWAWHEMPNPDNYVLDDAMTEYDTPRGKVSYPDRYAFTAEGKIAPGSEAGAWLHANPQRMDLGRIGLILRKSQTSEQLVDPQQLDGARQSLDLWRGTAHSQFRFEGENVRVETVAAPEGSAVAFRITSPLLADGRLGVTLRFPYASDGFLDTADWEAADRHTSTLKKEGEGHVRITRQLDRTRYVADAQFDSGSVRKVSEHEYELTTEEESLLLVVRFAPDVTHLQGSTTFHEIADQAAESWRSFWLSGAAIELSSETDVRAKELERRIVLSQYLTRVNSAGSLPPQETGLVTNSWHGKFHLEMHFWHGAHFAPWGRPDLLERSFPWYLSVLEKARKTATRQGYPGARWPKQVGPDGRESPSEIGSLLIWQQPHILYMLELAWEAGSLGHRGQLVAQFAELVEDTAVFMAAFASERDGVFHLGSPVMPAQEFYDARTTEDPTFELAYWWWGLEIAQRWRDRQGIGRRAEWSDVQSRLATPCVRDGHYAAISTPPFLRRDDHPSLLAALGVVPPTPLIDPDTMARTLDSVAGDWDWATAFGWDYPVMAMTAGRLGKADLAIDLLMKQGPKNHFTTPGHNPQLGPLLPIYLPSNGAVLAAVSFLATAGADSSPLFPESWDVSAEGFIPWPQGAADR